MVSKRKLVREAKSSLTLSALRALLNDEPDTGVFTWKVAQKRNQVKVGDVAGSLMKTGYIEIGVNNSRFGAHQLAWFYMTGEWTEQIDHRNQIKSDNRFLNLRKATESQNKSNISVRGDNTSGFKGVTKDRRRSTWTADVRFEGKRYRKSGFQSAEEANEWAVNQRINIHGEFASN